jgi:branched-chain amino acid transport system substrate-binding protein
VRRTILSIAAVLTFACALAACGSSSSSTSSTAATSGVASSLPGKPIVLGTICSCSGPEAASIGAVGDTLQAWVRWTNANGGINGHPVKMIVLDDGGNATTSLQDAKELVQSDHVLAIVGEMSLLDGTWASYVQQQRVPVIGAALFNSSFLTNPDFFATGAENPTMLYGLVDQAKKAGASKIAIMPCAEAPACSQVPGLIAGIGGKVLGGVSVPYDAKITVSQASYTANCLAARSSGVNAAAVIENATTVVRVADQCAQQGYKPIELNISGTVGQVWAADPNLSGAIGIESNPVLADQSIPATRTFHTALGTYAPAVASSNEYNELDASAWASAQAFALAAKRAGIGPNSTSADLLKGLYTFKNETVDGLTPPLTYTQGQPLFVTCYFYTQIKAGKFVAPVGATPVCIPPAEAKAMAAMLKA